MPLQLINVDSERKGSPLIKEPRSGNPCYLCGEPTILISLYGLVYECCCTCDEQFILASRKERTKYQRALARIERDVNRMVTVFVVVIITAIVAAWVCKGYPLPFDFIDWR